MQDEATTMCDTTMRHNFLPLFPSASYGHVVDEEGDGATDNNSNNGEGASDDDVDGAMDDDGDGDSNGAEDNNDDDGDNGDNSESLVADDNDVEDVNVDNLLPRVVKRNDGCDKTKTEEEEMVTDSVAIHSTIKQITGRGGGRWRRL